MPRLDKSLTDELREDLRDLEASRRRTLDAVLTGDPAEAFAAQQHAVAVDDKWRGIYERNLAKVEAEVVDLPVCWCGHYERDHARSGYGETTRGCLHCPCDGYTGP